MFSIAFSTKHLATVALASAALIFSAVHMTGCSDEESVYELDNDDDNGDNNGDNTGDNNGDGNGDKPFNIGSCETLEAGEHDGFCGTIVDESLRMETFIRTIYLEMEENLVSIHFGNGLGGEAAQSIQLYLDLNENSFNCAGDLPVTVLFPVTSTDFILPLVASSQLLNTSCSGTLSRDGKVLTGTLDATLGMHGSSETWDLTDGIFRTTLPDGLDKVEAQVDESLTSYESNIQILHYSADRGLLFAGYPDDHESGELGWEIVISDDMTRDANGEASGHVNCENMTSRITYFRGSQQDDIFSTNGTKDCSIDWEIRDNVLTATFDATVRRAFDDTTTLSLTNGVIKMHLPDGPAGSPMN